MFMSSDIHSLTEFQRNAKEHLSRLASTGRPEVLTVNGKAQVVIQDARAYEEMVELLETLKQVKTAAEAFDRGEGHSVKKGFAELDKRIAAKYGK